VIEDEPSNEKQANRGLKTFKIDGKAEIAPVCAAPPIERILMGSPEGSLGTMEADSHQAAKGIQAVACQRSTMGANRQLSFNHERVTQKW
jgi:hypothetical protein